MDPFIPSVAEADAETRTRRIRWYGDPADVEQPDIGDVLSYSDPDGMKPDWFHLVHHATAVRGKAPHDLWLTVSRHDFGADGSIPAPVWQAYDAGACFFRAVRQRRRVPRHA